MQRISGPIGEEKMNTRTDTVKSETKVPKAVKASAARAEELHRQVYSTEVEEAPKVEGDNASENDAQNAPATAAEDKGNEPTKDTTPPLTSEGNDTTKAEGAGENLQHKYDSLMGRFKRQREQIDQMSSQISHMQSLLASAPKKEDTPSELQAERLITKEDEDEYGTEFLGVVGKKAKEELTPLVSELKSEIANLKAQLGQVGTHVDRGEKTRMESVLNDKVPDWRDLNTNDDFLEWLSYPDTFSGAVRQDLLNRAYQTNDIPRVVAFFEAYKRENSAVTAPVTSPPNNTNKVPLESFAAPGGAPSGSSAHPAGNEVPYISTAEITKFYADVSAGKFKNNKEEKVRMENQIFAAQAAGRITQ